MKKIFNIPASNSFVDVLAQNLLDEYENDLLGLANVLILLPNRRACRTLAEAFVKLKGMRPTLLPEMKAIGDVSEDELLLKGQNIEEDVLNMLPIIEPMERTMLFMRLIMSRYGEFGIEKISLAQACSLAQELGGLIDTASMFGLDWNNLANLAPEEYAAHWQETLKFLNIITKYWPDILKERGVVDAVERKNRLVECQSEIWKREQPKQRIIVAGTTAVSPALKKLVDVVSELENGEVWLYGLDRFLTDEDFAKVDESHPQFELKQLLDYLGLKRCEIKDLVSPINVEKEHLVSEILRPAISTEKWRNLVGKFSQEAVCGWRMLECDNQRLEALTIALIIRRALEEKEKTVALVTPDRVLARWVAADLQRWNIEVDDSAGVPLQQTKWGIFMRLCVASLMPDASKDKILALMKNELFACGLNLYQADIWAKNLDKIVWRQKEKHEQAEALLACFDKKTKIFANVLKEPKARLGDLLKLHIKIAEDLAMSDELDGATRLWRRNDGEAGALFFADFLAKADVLGEIDPKEYLDLFEKMMLGIMVRSKGNLHKRVRILGPMEARLSHYDEIILGGFNDGVWPVLPVSDPWMSRPMKKDFGFETPEKQIGVLGMDFANLLQSKKVYMTRAKMCGGTPMVKSRWWMRLETVLNAAILELEQDELRIEDLAVLLEKAEKYDKSVAPAPTPPVAARPRKLSASAVEKLMRDPYGVYAEYILKLKPLDDLEQKADYRDLGNLVHKVLENFGKKYDAKYPDNAAEILKQMVEMEFENCNFALEKQAFWRPKVEKMMDWIAANEAIYRKEIARIYTEVWGRFFIDDVPGGRFEIYAKADRVDRTIDGKINIIDYKTGSARKETEVRKGYAPQLPIEGLIAVEGGFDGIEKADVDSLMYWRLGDKVTDIKNDMADLLQNTKDRITKLVNLYDFESTGYLSRPNPKEAPSYSDYEHLARVKEWSVKSDGEEG